MPSHTVPKQGSGWPRGSRNSAHRDACLADVRQQLHERDIARLRQASTGARVRVEVVDLDAVEAVGRAAFDPAADDVGQGLALFRSARVEQHLIPIGIDEGLVLSIAQD